MRKVCLISNPDIVEAEKKVNEFLKKHQLIYDISYHSYLVPSATGAMLLNRIMIVYEESEEPTIIDRGIDSAYLETR